MNELEKEIEEAMVKGVPFVRPTDFKKGCNFILEKNIPVLFAEWHSEVYFYDRNLSEKLWNASYYELYDYWLNNVYGK